VAFTSNSGVVVPAGSRLPGTPEFQSTVQGSYDFTGPFDTSGQLSVTHAYVGDRVFTIEGDAAASSYSTVDVRLAFRKNQWGLGFFVNNVGDERGVSGAQRVNAFGAPGYTDYYLIRPRVVGLSLSYDMSL